MSVGHLDAISPNSRFGYIISKLFLGCLMRDDPNKRAPNHGAMISGSVDGLLTVGGIRDAIHDLGNDVEIDFGSALNGAKLMFYRLKWRGEKLLQMELNEEG